MNKYIKGAIKVLLDYLLMLVLFAVFIPAVMGIFSKNLATGLVIYSILIFLLLAFVVYSDMKQLAFKERRPQYDLNPYPLKGLVLGIIGFAPVILLELIYPFIKFNNEVADRVKVVTLKALLGPFYFVLKLFGQTLTAFIIATAILPVLAMLGYLAGFYNFELGKYFPKNKNQKNLNNLKK